MSSFAVKTEHGPRQGCRGGWTGFTADSRGSSSPALVNRRAVAGIMRWVRWDWLISGAVGSLLAALHLYRPFLLAFLFSSHPKSPGKLGRESPGSPLGVGALFP